MNLRPKTEPSCDYSSRKNKFLPQRFFAKGKTCSDGACTKAVAGDIISVEDDEALEQAKKRDHKIFITDVAISKVPYVQVAELSKDICEAIQMEHKEILRIAKVENNSNEVLSIMTMDGSHKVRVCGGEFRVDPSEAPEAVSLFYRAGRRELMFLHNHPSTNSFSLVDIGEFVRYGSLGILSVVTNQGGVYLLHKTSSYQFDVARDLIVDANIRRRNGIISHKDAVKEFLKKCHQGGIVYAKCN